MVGVAAFYQRCAGESLLGLTKSCFLDEMEDLISRRKLPLTEKAGFFFKSGSRQILTTSKNRHEQTPLFRWDGLLRDATTFSADAYPQSLRFFLNRPECSNTLRNKESSWYLVKS